MNNLETFLQVALTVVGAGFMAYIGVRVALAKISADVVNLKERQGEHGSRITRLEEKYFR